MIGGVVVVTLDSRGGMGIIGAVIVVIGEVEACHKVIV